MNPSIEFSSIFTAFLSHYGIRKTLAPFAVRRGFAISRIRLLDIARMDERNARFDGALIPSTRVLREESI